MSASGETTSTSEKSSNETKSDLPLASILPPAKGTGDNDILENGRVLRPGSTNPTKNQNGPTLRATVKPVKRFHFAIASASTQDSGVVAANTTANQTITTPLPHKSDSGDLLQSTSKTPLLVSTSNKVADDNEDEPQEALVEAGNSKELPKGLKTKRVKVWTRADKEMFYEAVQMHGKDFEAVRVRMANMVKKQGEEGSTRDKTKEQVRHFYYRTSRYIFKLIDEPVDKAEELRAILCYALLRRNYDSDVMFKRHGVLKLKQLLNGDSMNMKLRYHYNGNRYVIRNASKALQKILANQEREKAFPSTGVRRMKAPSRITLELLPLTMFAWNRVTAVAHNPRIKFDIPIDCEIKNIVQYLQLKWRFMSDKLYMVANEGRLKKELSLNDVNNYLSESSKTLTIFLPPDVGVRRTGNVNISGVSKRKTCHVLSYSIIPTSKKRKCTVKKDDAKQIEGSGAGENNDHNSTTPTTTLPGEKRKAEITSTEEKPDEPVEKKTKREDLLPQTSDTKVEVRKVESSPNTSVETSQDNIPPKNPASVPATCNETGEPKPGPSSSITTEKGEETQNKLPLSTKVVARKPMIKRFREREIEGDKILAELYILCGSPTVLKLCYDWKPICKAPSTISFSSSSISTPPKSTGSAKEKPLPPALSALIDVATAMQARLSAKKKPPSIVKSKVKKPPPPPKVSTSNRSVQCNLPIEKIPKTPKPPKATTKPSKAASKPSKAAAKPPKVTPVKTPKPPKPTKLPKVKLRRFEVTEKTSDGFIIPAVPRTRKKLQDVPQADLPTTSEIISRKEVLDFNRRRHLFKLSGKPAVSTVGETAYKDCMVKGKDVESPVLDILMKKLSPPSTPESSSSQQLPPTSTGNNDVILHDADDDSLSGMSDILSSAVDDADMSKIDDILSRIVSEKIGEASSADLNAVCRTIEKSASATAALRIAASTASSLSHSTDTLTTRGSGPSSSGSKTGIDAEDFLLSPELVRYLQNHNSRDSYELAVADNGSHQQQEKQQQPNIEAEESQQDESTQQKLEYKTSSDSVVGDSLNFMGEMDASTTATIMPSPQFSTFMKDVTTPAHITLDENSKDSVTALKELPMVLTEPLTEDTDSRDTALREYFASQKLPSSQQLLTPQHMKTPERISTPQNVSTPQYTFTPQRMFPNEDSQDSLIFSLSQCHSKIPTASSTCSSPRRPVPEAEPDNGVLLMGDESVDLIQRFNKLIKETDTIEQPSENWAGPK